VADFCGHNDGISGLLRIKNNFISQLAGNNPVSRKILITQFGNLQGDEYMHDAIVLELF
jgi:hypothetical protein